MFEFKFADIGEGIHEGVLLKWFVKEGDNIKEGDSLFLVETDKVNAEIPSPVGGKINKLMAEVGDTIHVGNTVVIIDDGRELSETKKEQEPVSEDEKGAGVVGEIEVSSEIIESSDEGKYEEKDIKVKVLATPVARKLAKDLGVDINQVKGTGPAGRVMKEDIQSYNEKNKDIKESNVFIQPVGDTFIKQPAIREEIKVYGEVERVPISRLRKTVAENMVLSKTIIPHATTMDEFDVTELVKIRTEQKEIAIDKGINLTYIPFIIKALTIALKEFPVFNSSFDDIKDEIIYKRYYNIGIATDTQEGLMVPVIKNVDSKGILELAKDLDETIEKTRNRTIGIEELYGGTFTITNYGALGSTYGVPVIRYPEVAILGIGKIDKKPVVLNDEIVIRHMMPVSLSIDHRIIDGGDAGRFLMRLKELLSNPMLLLLS
ncbi:pyruvate dehydrogenase E2 component (dihydrolipoamide acetyltransferase) [Proteiniborus ethanoligenes]|uniref:Dihydrolipoamide acetyltransferase component of pyruvate dehydrogenase complex n=1 Tax=Proteiniborus ethanoligenes TaxID=415015 RepID=A0A1H3RQQ5_9FIRM|nr:dihydrolipoamide acetyltransferase family protein [Proteiniborus ethanoligenes]SDZ28026.1 pyruvate dehydrogenase E2 component (dihydrolipoamide acetyltransferase) [Proteiniborus ethanoligenes]